MAIGECPNPQVNCKYYNRRPVGKLKQTQEHGCFSDLDHIVPQRLGRKAGINAAYIQLAVNKQQLCRRIHEQKTAAGDEPLPSLEHMAQALQSAHDLGEIVLRGSVAERVQRLNSESAAQAAQIEASNDVLRTID